MLASFSEKEIQEVVILMDKEKKASGLNEFTLPCIMSAKTQFFFLIHVLGHKKNEDLLNFTRMDS